MTADLLAHFNRYFDLIQADTPALREEAFRLRYEVYCVEGAVPGFDQVDYPHGIEQDTYDARSLHCLLRHRATGSCAGTVRVILNREADLIARNGAISAHVGECSRFVLAKTFRSRAGEAAWADGVADTPSADRRAQVRSTPDRRASTHPILGLIKACVMMSYRQQVCYWLAGFEERFDRMLRRFDLAFTEASPVIECHGSIRAYWGYLPDLLTRIRERQPLVWDLLTDNGEITKGL